MCCDVIMHVLRCNNACAVLSQVEMAGTGNESWDCRQQLSTLSDTDNILVMRHPNKFFGGSTALLWSHHEKLVIIDR
jgi:hypothetical protein